MINWTELSNKEIEIELNNLELEHTKIKNDLVKFFDRLTELEKQYNKGIKEIQKRK